MLGFFALGPAPLCLLVALLVVPLTFAWRAFWSLWFRVSSRPFHPCLSSGVTYPPLCAVEGSFLVLGFHILRFARVVPLLPSQPRFVYFCGLSSVYGALSRLFLGFKSGS